MSFTDVTGSRQVPQKVKLFSNGDQLSVMGSKQPNFPYLTETRILIAVKK